MRIVIVDDEYIICEGITRIISDSRPECCTVSAVYQDAEEALETCDWENVELLFIDINMPGMNGLEMVGALRERGWDTLVVIISGFAQFEYARTALQHKAVDFILKPLSPESILSSVDKAKGILGARRKERESKCFIQDNMDRLAREYFGELLFETRRISEPQKAQFDTTLRLSDKRFTLFVFAMSASFDLSDIERRAERFVKTPCYCYSSGTETKTVLIVYDKSRELNVDRFRDFLRSEFGILLGVDSSESDDFGSLGSLYTRSLETIRNLSVTDPVRSSAPLSSENDILPGKEVLSIPVREVVKIIHEEFSKPLSLSILSEKVCVHPTYLSNVFKKQTGFALIEYINQYRVEQAKILLRDPFNKIFWVSERVGFANQRYFSQVFKKITGLTPVEYRSDFYLSQESGPPP